MKYRKLVHFLTSEHQDSATTHIRWDIDISREETMPISRGVRLLTPAAKNNKHLVTYIYVIGTSGTQFHAGAITASHARDKFLVMDFHINVVRHVLAVVSQGGSVWRLPGTL